MENTYSIEKEPNMENIYSIEKEPNMENIYSKEKEPNVEKIYSKRRNLTRESIYIHTLLVRLSVRLCPIKIKTTEPIGPTFFCGNSIHPSEGFGRFEIEKLSVVKGGFFFFHKFINVT